MKYIIFYATESGLGSTDVKLKFKERLNSISKIRDLENSLKQAFKTNVVITNFKFVGWTWK